MKQLTSMQAQPHPKFSGKKHLESMRIERAANGFVAHHNFARPEHQGFAQSPDPEQHIINTPQELGAHVAHHFGGKAKAGGPQESKAVEAAEERAENEKPK